MEKSLKQINIEKNKEFERLVKPYLLINIIMPIVLLITPVIGGFLGIDDETSESMYVFAVISLFLTITLYCFNFGEKCPECAARNYKEEVNRNRISESVLGHKYQTRSDGTKYKTHAILSRIYEVHNICKYCGYKWKQTVTKKEEEQL